MVHACVPALYQKRQQRGSYVVTFASAAPRGRSGGSELQVVLHGASFVSSPFGRLAIQAVTGARGLHLAGVSDGDAAVRGMDVGEVRLQLGQKFSPARQIMSIERRFQCGIHGRPMA